MVDYPNIFATGMGAFDDQTRRLQAATQYAAERQAGQAVSAGDYSGAAGALGGAGDLAGQQRTLLAGRQANQFSASQAAGSAIARGDFGGASSALGAAGDLAGQQTAITAGRASTAHDATVNAATAYAKGDPQGAMTALAPAGDLQNQEALHNQLIQQTQAKMAFGQQEAAKLQAIRAQAQQAHAPDGGIGALLQAYDAQTGLYKQMGSTDQEIAQMRQGLQANPDATLTALANPPKLSFQKIGDNSLGVFNETTGQMQGRYNGSKFEKLGPGDTLVDTSGDGGSPPSGSAPAATAGDSRGARNNNPLNLTTLPQGQWAGQTGADGKFAVFSTPEAGIAAADKNLQSYATNHGINTLTGIINRWAPAGDGTNNPQAYIATVAKDAGIDPTAPLDLSDPKVRAVILHSMAKVEMGGSGSAPQTAAAPANLPGGARVVAQGPMAASMAATAGNPNLSGADYLATLPPALKNSVKAIAEGRLQPPNPNSRAPQAQMLMEAVTQYDPTFNAADFNARSKALQNATSGKMFRDVTAYNTALAHMDLLLNSIDKLGNYSLPANNAAAHVIAGLTGDDARIQTFETAKRTALDEVNKALIGGGGALGDREALMARMKDAANPKTLYAVVGEVASLLEGKINEQQSQYNSVMGGHSPMQFLSPHAQAVVDRINSGSDAKPSALPNASKAAAPKPGTVMHYNAQGQLVQ